MRVLIIGGTNFIGPHVVTALDQFGAEITVYHRGVHEPQLPAHVRHIHSARASLPILHYPPELTDPAPDVVLLMFAVGADDARAAMARFTGSASRIVVISSGDVYRAYGRLLGTEPGAPDPGVLTETADLRETYYPYRATAAGPSDWIFHYDKILAERAAIGREALPATILRLPAVYGPGDSYHRFRRYIKRMQDGRSTILVDRVEATWRWSHGYVENVAQAIALAVTNPRSAGQTYNIGEAHVPTVGERIQRIGDLAGWKGSIVALPRERVPPHLRSPYEPTQDLVLDTRKFTSEIGLVEPLPDEEGIRRTIAWEQGNSLVAGDPGPLEYAAEDAALR